MNYDFLHKRESKTSLANIERNIKDVYRDNEYLKY